MNGVTRRESSFAKYKVSSAFGVRKLNRIHFVDKTNQGRERRLDRVAAIDCDVPVKDFLEHFRIGDQRSSFCDESFEEPACVILVRVRRADQIHRDVRIDKDHLRPVYPA